MTLQAPPDSWLDDTNTTICPTCWATVAWGLGGKIGHQQWHKDLLALIAKSSAPMTERWRRAGR